MLNKTIKELHEDLISGKVTSDELVKKVLRSKPYFKRNSSDGSRS